MPSAQLEAALTAARMNADTSGRVQRANIPEILRLLADAYACGVAEGILTLGPAGDCTYFKLEGRTTP